jgi:hypothetical protein
MPTGHMVNAAAKPDKITWETQPDGTKVEVYNYYPKDDDEDDPHDEARRRRRGLMECADQALVAATDAGHHLDWLAGTNDEEQNAVFRTAMAWADLMARLGGPKPAIDVPWSTRV